MNKESNQSPEFHGQCAFAISTGKKGVEGKENCYLIQDGKKYLFSNPVAKFLWRILPGRKEKCRIKLDPLKTGQMCSQSAK